MTACQAERSDLIVETPTLFVYAPEVQARARAELPDSKEHPPCPRTEVTKDCSALRRLMLDYKQVRDQIRQAKEAN